MTQRTRAALYLRVSTTRQEEGYSLETQEAGCRAYAAQHGLDVDEAHVYQEVFTGVELWERPQLTRLREAIHRQQIDAVICYAIDRLARDPVHLGVVLSEADHKGVRVEFVTEAIDDTPEGQLIRFVRGYAAKVEHEKIRERSLRGKRARALSGKLLAGGSSLYGYDLDRENGVRTINPSEAAIVREIFRAYVTDGVAMNDIARRLNARGLPSPTAHKRVYADARTPTWRQATIRNILLHEAYIGESYAWKWQTVSRNKAPVLRRREEWIALPKDTTPPLIDRATWEAAQRKIETNRGEHARNRERPALLRGLIFCAVCGRRMWVDWYHKRLYYRCPAKTLTGERCGGVIVQAKPVEEAAWAHVVACIRDPQLIERELMAATPQLDQQVIAEIETINRRLSQVVRGQERLLARYSESESVPWELIEREVARAEDEKARLRADLVQLEARRAGHNIARRQIGSLTAWCERVTANLDAMTFDERRRTLEVLALRVFASGFEYDFRLDPQVF
ncbi:MAG TPA: hypothetical protein DEU95_13845 [Chloroflexi bacterium]|nr:hypothetical protein [Chloroflexota bacterium]